MFKHVFLRAGHTVCKVCKTKLAHNFKLPFLKCKSNTWLLFSNKIYYSSLIKLPNLFSYWFESSQKNEEVFPSTKFFCKLNSLFCLKSRGKDFGEEGNTDAWYLRNTFIFFCLLQSQVSILHKSTSKYQCSSTASASLLGKMSGQDPQLLCCWVWYNTSALHFSSAPFVSGALVGSCLFSSLIQFSLGLNSYRPSEKRNNKCGAIEPWP